MNHDIISNVKISFPRTTLGMQRFVWEIMKKPWVWNDFLKNMCSKDITLVPECVLWLGLSVRPLLNFTQKLDSFGEPLFFYPVANAFSQTNCQIPLMISTVFNPFISPF